MVEIKKKDTGEVLATIDADSLICADLAELDLRGADMSGLNLQGANFLHSDLSEADLSNANLEQAHYREPASIKPFFVRQTCLIRMPVQAITETGSYLPKQT